MMDKAIEAMARGMVGPMSGGQEDMCGGALPDKTYDDLTPDWQNAFLDYAQAAKAALEDAGFVIVPKVPTEGMVAIGGGAVNLKRHIYTAMLEAAAKEQADG